MKKCCLFLLLCLFLNFCNENISKPEETKFNDFTNTGINSPDPIGHVDSDDWRMILLNGNSTKDSLIMKVDTVLYQGSIKINMPNKFNFYPAYPNPAIENTFVNLSFDLLIDSYISLRIYDKPNHLYRTILDSTFSLHGQYHISEMLPKGFYRVCLNIKTPYSIYESYGDVQINPIK